MLALSRKAGERLLIGDDIVVHVVRTGVTVGLAIEAPANVKILRGELVGKPHRIVEGTVAENAIPPTDEPKKLEAA